MLEDKRSFKSSNFALLKTDFTQEDWYREVRDAGETVWMGAYGDSRVANNMRSGYVAVGTPLVNVRSGMTDGHYLHGNPHRYDPYGL